MAEIKLKFDKNNSSYWEETRDYNRLFINAQLTYFRQILDAYNFLTLYDVLRQLGFDVKSMDRDILFTEDGMPRGWYSTKYTNLKRDCPWIIKPHRVQSHYRKIKSGKRVMVKEHYKRDINLVFYTDI